MHTKFFDNVQHASSSSISSITTDIKYSTPYEQLLRDPSLSKEDADQMFQEFLATKPSSANKRYLVLNSCNNTKFSSLYKLKPIFNNVEVIKGSFVIGLTHCTIGYLVPSDNSKELPALFSILRKINKDPFILNNNLLDECMRKTGLAYLSLVYKTSDESQDIAGNLAAFIYIFFENADVILCWEHFNVAILTLMLQSLSLNVGIQLEQAQYLLDLLLSIPPANYDNVYGIVRIANNLIQRFVGLQEKYVKKLTSPVETILHNIGEGKLIKKINGYDSLNTKWSLITIFERLHFCHLEKKIKLIADKLITEHMIDYIAHTSWGTLDRATYTSSIAPYSYFKKNVLDKFSRENAQKISQACYELELTKDKNGTEHLNCNPDLKTNGTRWPIELCEITSSYIDPKGLGHVPVKNINLA
jgi:hypothetical protein